MAPLLLSSTAAAPPPSSLFLSPAPRWSSICRVSSAASPLCGSDVALGEAGSEEELWAAVRLRTRTFYEFNQWYYNEDYKQYLMRREFEALKDRIDGKRKGFKRVSCINATMSLSPYLASDGLSSSCKYSNNGEDRVVVGSLDLNQCRRLANELAGKMPEDAEGSNARAYLTNVCVAAELQRNGLGFALVDKSLKVARRWGITDLYVHVAVDNEAAQKLYEKTGFIYENEESVWEAKLRDRPRRYLLRADLLTAKF